MGADRIVKDLVIKRMVGIGLWNLTEEKFTVVEEITDFNQHEYATLTEFIGKIVSPLDKQMVLCELEEYIQQPKDDYQSTFRLKTEDGSPRWVTLKGNEKISSTTGDELFYIVILNVSGGNFMTGNDKRTNLLEADFFLKKVTGALECKPHLENLVLIRMAITNFQQIKEKYQLNTLLKLVEKTARRLKFVFSEKAELTRFSNDIYLAMVTEFKSQSEVEALTDSILEVFKEPFVVDNNLIQVKMSLGVTGILNEGSSVADLILQSEFATQQSKKAGDYVTTFFNQELAEKFRHQLIIETDLSQAIEEQALIPFFQPQFNSNTNRLTGIEVLARWNHPELGFIPPIRFIQVAEKQGLMPILGRSILEKSIQVASDWLDKGYEIGVLSVNVSPMELIDSKFLPNLLKTCEKYQFPPEQLEIEITEGVFLDAIGHSDRIIDELDSRGFRIAVDDFGVGYSNLSFISNTKLDTLKIDKTLIDQLTDKKGSIVVEAVVKLAQQLNYNVIAEGVESKQQVLCLSQIDCNIIQGYYYSQPLPAEEMEQMLKEHIT